MKRFVLAVLIFVAAGFIDLKPMLLSNMKNPDISVFVDGAVANPGYIRLEKYACEKDALSAAVPLANADLTGVNPMTILKDKDYINIPVKKETDTSKVSINTGTLEDLCTLNGIGEGTAEKIIAYRSENGLFQSLDEIMQVTGIGQAKYDRIKEQICL